MLKSTKSSLIFDAKQSEQCQKLEGDGGAGCRPEREVLSYNRALVHLLMVLGLQLPSLFGTWISRESENIRVRFRFCIAARTLNSSLPWISLNTYLVLSLYLTSGVSVSKKHCASLWKSSKFMTLCGKLSGIWWQGLQKWYCGIQWLPIGYSSTFPKFGTCTIDTRK